MLHFLPYNNKLHKEQSAQSVMEYTAEYEIDDRSVYDILDQIYKETDLYPCIKQYKFKRDGRGAFYTIPSSWLGPYINAWASEAN